MFHHGKTTRRDTGSIKRIIVIVLVTMLVLLIGSAIVTSRMYSQAFRPVSEDSREVVLIVVTEGSSVQMVGKQLRYAGLIHSELAFTTHLRLNGLSSQIKAGTFELSPGWSLKEIVSVLISGDEASELFTIAPGLRLQQIKQRLLDAGFVESEVDIALLPETYPNHPALRHKPASATLEGYIYPESFRITASTSPQEIVRQSLDELDKVLSEDIIEGIRSLGLTVHEGLILGSIIEKEVPGFEDKTKVAQVMLKRLDIGMKLGADATYLYASAVFGGEPFPSNPSAYNTRIFEGLPPGPISNISKATLEALINPSSSDYLYYVTGDDGVNHFTSTEAEHQAAVKMYCTITCAPGYVAPNY